MLNAKVRSAPSPSGTLHLGNAKTFLFNYLFSKKYNADFILRIEDTDISRVVEDGAKKIFEDLKWLGLSPSVGWGVPGYSDIEFTQIGRLHIYKEYADQLLEKKLAYKCYCSEDELNRAREAALVKNPKSPFKYPGTCRDLKEDLNKPFVVRLRVPTEGHTEFQDSAFGKMKVSNKENYDFIIFRQNGIPLFNFANVIDDLAIDGITHVIRGSDHIKNTPQQIMIADALGFNRPIYHHLPMLMNGAGEKLSKRDGSVSVAEYRNAGYTPSGILNYLVRFGWGFGNQEIFSMDELIEKFSLEACGKNDGKFDAKKFASIQFEHLKSSKLTPDDEYIERLIPFLEKKGLVNCDLERIKSALPLIRPRAHTLIEAADEIEPFIIDEINTNLSFKDTPDSIKEKVPSLIEEFKSLSSWEENNLRILTKDWLTKNNLSLKELGGFMRLSLTGRFNSPELFQVMALLGQGRSLKRLGIGLARLKAP